MPDDPLFVVQPMTLAELDQVMKIEQVAFSSPWPRRAFHYEVDENTHSTMVVVRPAPRNDGWVGRFVVSLGVRSPAPLFGYAGAWLLVDEFHISTIAVHPQYQRRGLGELLLLSLLDRGSEQGARRATLEVRVSNLAAQGLYRGCGFETVARQKRYYVDNNEDAYIMATPAFESPEFQARLHQRRTLLDDRFRSGARDAE